VNRSAPRRSVCAPCGLPRVSPCSTGGTPLTSASTVVLGCHYTNTSGVGKDQVTTTLEGDAITLAAANAVLRLGNGDR
jgi:hypothetical protein